MEDFVEMCIIRQARVEDASRIAEILVFSKRMNYRKIFCYCKKRMQVSMGIRGKFKSNIVLRKSRI